MEIMNFFDALQTWDHVEALITDDIRESETVEYKGAATKFLDRDKNEIPKDVSAMANSSGGVLIYGIDCDVHDKTKPVKVSGIAEVNIETFDRVVNSQIRREIKGIQKKIVSNGLLKVMIVLVPQSAETPHQSLTDKKYYRRSLGESVPMEHDIVELHFGKRLGPILDVNIVDIEDKDVSKLSFKEDGFSEPIRFRVFVVNTGQRVGRFVEILFRFPDATKVRITNSGGLTNIDALYAGANRQARQFTDNAGVFHPQMNKSIAEITVELSKTWIVAEGGKEPLIKWTIYADEMSPREDEAYLTRGQAEEERAGPVAPSDRTKVR